jgi:protein FAM50
MSAETAEEREQRLRRKREREVGEYQKRVDQAGQRASESRLVGFAFAGDSEDRATSHEKSAETAFQASTVGLNSRQRWQHERQASAARARESRARQNAEREQQADERFAKRTKRSAPVLSFLDAEDEAEAGSEAVPLSEKLSLSRAADNDKAARAKPGKDPKANTQFLPDRQREEAEEREKERLRQEFEHMRKREEDKEVELLVTFWGQGGGRRRTIAVRKGETILGVVRIAKERLSREHKDLNAASSHNVLLVKNGIIIPHRFKMYDLEARNVKDSNGSPLLTSSDPECGNRYRDKSGGVWKLVVRSTYERFKHHHPLCTWEQLEALPVTVPGT